jgi:hypothetical protein
MPDVAQLLAAYDEQVRSSEAGNLSGDARTEVDGPIVRIVGQFRGFISPPADLGLDGEELDALIHRQREFFAARGEAVEWKTRAHDRPPGITGHLRAAGFVPEPEETVMIGIVSDLARLPDRPPDGVAIRAVTADDDLRRIADMESAVWDEDLSWMADDLAGRLRRDPRQLTVLIAEAGRELVAAAWLAFKPGTEFAALWGGSTLAPWRRRGIYRILVARRARLARQRGVRYLQVDASDDSRPVLGQLGFVAVTTTTPYVWSPPTVSGGS